MQEIQSLLSSLSSPSLIHPPHTWGYAIRLHFASCTWAAAPLPVLGKKMFSNIFHLPLFISILCWMSLTACKLVYNAVPPWRGVCVWGGGVRQKHKPGGGSRGWRTFLGVMRHPRWKPIGWKPIDWGQFSSSVFLTLREERFRVVIGFGITMATAERSARWVKEWDEECVCVC